MGFLNASAEPRGLGLRVGVWGVAFSFIVIVYILLTFFHLSFFVKDSLLFVYQAYALWFMIHAGGVKVHGFGVRAEGSGLKVYGLGIRGYGERRWDEG